MSASAAVETATDDLISNLCDLWFSKKRFSNEFLHNRMLNLAGNKDNLQRSENGSRHEHYSSWIIHGSLHTTKH